MLTHLLSEGLKKENRLFSGMLLIATVIVGLLLLHYVFGFFPSEGSYLRLPS
jgi:hypothetical protein